MMNSYSERDWKPFFSSGLVSVCLHAFVLVISALSLRGCDKGSPIAASTESFRDVGLAIVDDSGNHTDTPFEADVQEPTQATDSNVKELINPVQDSLPTELPVLDSFPAEIPSTTSDRDLTDLPDVIGSGTPITQLPPMPVTPSVTGQRETGMTANGAVIPGPGETAFMNVLGKGDSFVYVIDMSGSMKSGGHLNEARSQLVSSLELLQTNQRFQILFYNDKVSQLDLDRKPKIKGMYTATKDKIYLAKKKIARELATGGTEHFQPLLQALDLNPDVIYFLTDGETSLRQGQLRELQRHNMSAAQIHVIDLSSGPRETRQQPWLERLAAQFRGVYVRRGGQ